MTSLRNLGELANKTKEISVIDQELNDSNLMQKIIKYKLNGIKDDIHDVYGQEKVNLHRHLDQLLGLFNVDMTISNCVDESSFLLSSENVDQANPPAGMFVKVNIIVTLWKHTKVFGDCSVSNCDMHSLPAKTISLAKPDVLCLWSPVLFGL